MPIVVNCAPSWTSAKQAFKHCSGCGVARIAFPIRLGDAGSRHATVVGCAAGPCCPRLEGHDARAGFSTPQPATRVLITDGRSRTRRALRALLDARMPRLAGIAATATTNARWPDIRVVVHRLATDDQAEALAAGADAFVPRRRRPDERLEALRPGAQPA